MSEKKPKKKQKKKKRRMRRWAWKSMSKLFGEHPELAAARTELERLQWELEAEQGKLQEVSQRLTTELEQAREERLQWKAKESSTRKELQDCQARAKDLLEQVVSLTHKQRAAKQSLLDQQFKTETTPLERNRFEMDLTEARGKARRAEEQAKRAEQELARLRSVEKRAAKAKELEKQVAWLTQKSEAYHQALASAVDKVRDLEEQLPRRKVRKLGKRRTYRKPRITSKKGKPQR
jgi:chromosome segregation ATPase